MKSAARCIATAAVALIMLPALHADDTAKPNANAAKDAHAASSSAPTAVANVQPGADTVLPARFSTSLRSQPGSSSQSPAAPRKWDASDNYTPKFEWSLGYSFW
jgi:hypothetical protein